MVFANDGVTLLEQLNKDEPQEDNSEDIDLQVNINLEEVVDTNAHLVGMYP